MNHNCQHRDDEGDVYPQFMDSVMDGTFEYDDFYDCYLWFRPRFKEKKWYWPFKRHSLIVDVLCYCPFCGKQLKEPIGELIKEENE